MKKSLMVLGMISSVAVAHASVYPVLALKPTSEIPSSIKANQESLVNFELTAVNNVKPSTFTWILPSNTTVKAYEGNCPNFSGGTYPMAEGSVCKVTLSLKANQGENVSGLFAVRVIGKYGHMHRYRWDSIFAAPLFYVEVK